MKNKKRELPKFFQFHTICKDEVGIRCRKFYILLCQNSPRKLSDKFYNDVCLPRWYQCLLLVRFCLLVSLSMENGRHKMPANDERFTLGLRSVASLEGQTGVKAYVSGVGGLCAVARFVFFFFIFLRWGALDC